MFCLAAALIRINFQIWEMYLNGIGEAGDELNEKEISNAA